MPWITTVSGTKRAKVLIPRTSLQNLAVGGRSRFGVPGHARWCQSSWEHRKVYNYYILYHYIYIYIITYPCGGLVPTRGILLKSC